MSDLVEQYKALTVELVSLEAKAEKIKGEREVICGQLLAKDGKGHPYDLGDGMPMIVATTKIGSHYMAPKNKWQKAGRPPKPPKQPRAPKAAKEKPAPKPLMKRAIVGGKIVEIPIEPKRASAPPPAVPASAPVAIEPPPAPIPEVQLPAPEPELEVTVKAGVAPVVVEASKVEIKLDEPGDELDALLAAAPASEPIPVEPAKLEPIEIVAEIKKPEPAPQKELDPLEAALAELDIE